MTTLTCRLSADITARINNTDVKQTTNDTKLAFTYMKTCHESITECIFDDAFDDTGVDGLDYTQTSYFENDHIICRFTFDEELDEEQIQEAKEAIEYKVDNGVDTWGGSDLTIVDDNICNQYNLGDIEKNRWLIVFFTFVDFVE